MPECYILGLNSDLTSEPEARAQRGSAARWDLCGGRPEPDGVKGRPYRDRSAGGALLKCRDAPQRAEVGLPNVKFERLAIAVKVQ